MARDAVGKAVGAAVSALALAFLTMALSGCGCTDRKLPEEHVKRMEENGVELVGDSDEFRVQVKYITCKEVNDGLFGGSAEEPTFFLSCAREGAVVSSEYASSFEEGDVKDYHKPGATDDVCFYAGVMTVECSAGSGVVLQIREEDDFSSAETGETTIPWDMIEFMTHGMQINFGISTQSTGSWDQFWNGALDLIGGICITDLIPGGKAAKAARLSVKAVRRIKKANKAIRRYQKAQGKLEECSEFGVEPCGDAASTMEALWNAQCINADAGGGSYNFVLQFSGCARMMLSMTSVAVCYLSLTA